MGHFSCKPCTCWFIVICVWILLWSSLRSPLFFSSLSLLHVTGFFPEWMFEEFFLNLWNSITGPGMCFNINNSAFLKAVGSLSICRKIAPYFQRYFLLLYIWIAFLFHMGLSCWRTYFVCVGSSLYNVFTYIFVNSFNQFYFPLHLLLYLQLVFYIGILIFSYSYNPFFIDWFNTLAF